jgi:phosphoribosylformylglycinamidine (FGAM) synthase-like enzyme
LQPIKGAPDGVAVTIDSNTYGTKDPYVAGAYAVAEAIRNIIAVGADPIALTDCLNYGNPEKGDVFFDFKEGVRGIGDAARQLSTHDDVVPIISGNVSFYNESASGQAVVPSPVICCIGRMPDAMNAHRMQLVESESTLYVLGQRHAQFAETELMKTLHELEIPWSPNTVPQVYFESEKAMNQALHQAVQANEQGGLVQAVHDISQGGVWQSLVEMVGGDRNWPLVGLDIECPVDVDPVTFLFSESGGYVCEVKESHRESFEILLNDHGVEFYDIGKTTLTDKISISHDSQQLIDLSTNDCLTAWNQKNKQTAGTPIYNESI